MVDEDLVEGKVIVQRKTHPNNPNQLEEHIEFITTDSLDTTLKDEIDGKLVSPINESDVTNLVPDLASKLTSPIAESDVTGLVSDLDTRLKFLGKTTLSSPADSISVTGLPLKTNYFVIFRLYNSGSITLNMRINGDGNGNYGRRLNTNGAADSTATGATSMLCVGSSSNKIFAFGWVRGKATNIKSVILNAMDDASTPNRYQMVGRWNNTVDAINEIDAINGGTGDYDTGSEVEVYGID